jgi:hypothetical protein
MTIDPVKIPQNVYVEDRIIGPITLRQIIICLLSGALSYGFFSTLKTAGALTPITAVFAWTPLAIGAAFAFVKINGISLTRFCLLIAERMEKAPVRRWSPRRGITITISTGTAKTEEEIVQEQKMKTATKHAEEKHKRIRELSVLLDRGPESADDETDAMTNERSHSLPVDRTRITADANTAPSVDGFQAPARGEGQVDFVRDITPPSAS